MSLLKVSTHRNSALGHAVVDFNVVFFKSNGIRRNIVAGIMPQSLVFREVEAKMSLLAGAEEIVQHLQAVIVGICRTMHPGEESELTRFPCA